MDRELYHKMEDGKMDSVKTGFTSQLTSANEGRKN